MDHKQKQKPVLLASLFMEKKIRSVLVLLQGLVLGVIRLCVSLTTRFSLLNCSHKEDPASASTYVLALFSKTKA